MGGCLKNRQTHTEKNGYSTKPSRGGKSPAEREEKEQ